MSPSYFADVGHALTDLWDVQRIAKSHLPQSELGANVRITQNSHGRMVDARLLMSSSDAAVDVGLIEDLRAGADRLPPPPPGVLRGRERFSSLWYFKYVPGAGISTSINFDLVNLLDHRAIPKPNNKHVELLEAD